MYRIAPSSARSACHPRRSPNMPKRPQGVPLTYRRRHLDSLNQCSISFSDQIPAGGGADRKRETVFGARRFPKEASDKEVRKAVTIARCALTKKEENGMPVITGFDK